MPYDFDRCKKCGAKLYHKDRYDGLCSLSSATVSVEGEFGPTCWEKFLRFLEGDIDFKKLGLTSTQYLKKIGAIRQNGDVDLMMTADSMYLLGQFLNQENKKC